MNNIKQALEKIEIPKDLNSRVTLGVKQAKMERQKRRNPKWMLASVAAVMIIGTGLSLGGSHIADAAESIISQLFGSKENLMKTYPDDEPEKFDLIDQSLVVAQENLTEEEFNEYTKLMKELVALKSKLQKENREPSEKEANRSHEIKEIMRPYENKFMPIFSQQLASFTLTKKPAYLPQGYELDFESYGIANKGEEPVVSFDYRKGESWFNTQQLKINQLTDLERPGAGLFKKTESYSLNGFQFDYVSKEQSQWLGGLRIKVPEKGYKIVLITDKLSKEEMEKVLLSMIEK
ncbi:DUF4367 domain-containing protein [Neobacillus sp. MM2021_6]|uniref:DUF4367 domain-containing protein n=1 Tax=Bacillaceae TaxID=186817 RepID=UPI00140DE5A0|nr:DUF4367 domain-containing protein [Neobacillus sp. MM2021_6]NHC21257.1 DUF4367 domain-containing protein [Bacillus sp. MM2020_4]